MHHNLSMTKISEEWKEFINYHTSSDFTDNLFEIFINDIKKIYKVNKDQLPK